MPIRIRFLNAVLFIFGFKMVERRIGFWRVIGGQSVRTTYPLGYRVGRRSEQDGPNTTELDRFVARHAKEIDARRKALR